MCYVKNCHVKKFQRIYDTSHAQDLILYLSIFYYIVCCSFVLYCYALHLRGQIDADRIGAPLVSKTVLLKSIVKY